MASSWEDLLDEFRALGGRAENVCLRDGPFGRGVFPQDPAKPVDLHAPESLLVETKYISFDGGEFRWHKNAPLDARQRAFLETYQRDFSWGVNRVHTEELLRMVADAPEELRALLDTPFNVDLWLTGPTEDAVRECFFGARYIGHEDRKVLMPLIDLVNHGPFADSYNHDNGIGISGQFDGEVLACYAFADALDVFRYWGFASMAQPFALSLGMGIETSAGEIVIGRDDVDPDPNRRPFFPDVKIEGRRITLSHLMLGHKKYPKLAKANFYRILRDAGRSGAEEAFDKIAHINRSQFLKLMAASEKAEPPLGRLIRDVARAQLEAISCAVGTREI